ncbi:hypothetical protein ABW19_dt0207187 [Dactylella cylindrospora]|nr:hypothetical protein ABW19_dt0207187 [Dactylella cylindrospora]
MDRQGPSMAFVRFGPEEESDRPRCQPEKKKNGLLVAECPHDCLFDRVWRNDYREGAFKRISIVFLLTKNSGAGDCRVSDWNADCKLPPTALIVTYRDPEAGAIK